MSTRFQSVEVPAQLQHLRRKCWRVVLVLDCVSAPLCALAVATLPDPGRPLVALRALQQAAAKLRGVRHASHLRAHEAARDAASAALADADSDDMLLDQIVADLTAHARGDTTSLDWLDPSDIDPPLWSAYVSAVQATHRALWMARQDIPG
ncbi:MAG TPA: hypothetical protein VGB85_33730 [Nannocystis sp.]|jgi:hypothetical protein